MMFCSPSIRWLGGRSQCPFSLKAYRYMRPASSLQADRLEQQLKLILQMGMATGPACCCLGGQMCSRLSQSWFWIGGRGFESLVLAEGRWKTTPDIQTTKPSHQGEKDHSFPH